MAERRNAYNFLVVIIAGLGSMTYGYTASVLGNALGKPAFYAYLDLDPTDDHTSTLISIWSFLLYVGALVGCLLCAPLSTRFGRKIPIFIASLTSVLGGALQAGLVSSNMLCVARVVIGAAAGLLIAAVPPYQAEVSPPHGRGIMIGLHGCMLGFGLALAQWVGVACFHLNGSSGWRIPFAINCVPPAMLAVLIWTVPESPRWLYSHGRRDEALDVLIKLHKSPHDPTNSYALGEFQIMGAQLQLELETPATIWQGFKKPSIRKRFILGIVSQSGTQLSGMLTILTYQALIYSNLGFSPMMVGVLGGIWCSIDAVANFIGGFVVDKVGRRACLLVGYGSVCICLILECILVAKYSDGENKAGNRAAVFFIFLIVFVYCIGIETPSFVYCAEIFPTEWRAAGFSASMMGIFCWSIIFTGAAPSAFRNIGWRFYIVFAAATLMMLVIVFFFFPETKGYTLEQISVVFGDATATLQNPESMGKDAEKAEAEVVETEDNQSVTKVDASKS